LTSTWRTSACCSNKHLRARREGQLTGQHMLMPLMVSFPRGNWSFSNASPRS